MNETACGFAMPLPITAAGYQFRHVLEEFLNRRALAPGFGGQLEGLAMYF